MFKLKICQKFILILIIISLIFSINKKVLNKKIFFNNIVNVLNKRPIVHDSLNTLVVKIYSVIEINNSLKYLYLDKNDEEGTLNFYRIRYYLSPMKAINWNIYAWNLNLNSKEDIEKFIIDSKADYVIINDVNIKETLFPSSSTNSSIFKVNKNSNIQNEILTKIEL